MRCSSPSRHPLVALVGLTVLVAGCTTTATRDLSPDARPGSTLVTGLDIKRVGGFTALDGVRLLIRPPSMTGLTPATFRNPMGDPPVAYLDGARLTDIRTLEQVHYTAIASMRFLDASSATIRYGTGHFGGAVVVTTHKGPKGGIPNP